MFNAPLRLKDSLYGVAIARELFVLIAAIFGTSEMTPIAGAGHSGLQWQEKLVTVGRTSVGITMVAACAILLFGFVSHREKN